MFIQFIQPFSCTYNLWLCEEKWALIWLETEMKYQFLQGRRRVSGLICVFDCEWQDDAKQQCSETMLWGTTELFFLTCTQLIMLSIFPHFYVFILAYVKYWWQSCVNLVMFSFLISQEVQKEGVQHLTDSSKENLDVPKGQSKDGALNGQVGV